MTAFFDGTSCRRLKRRLAILCWCVLFAAAALAGEPTFQQQRQTTMTQNVQQFRAAITAYMNRYAADSTSPNYLGAYGTQVTLGDPALFQTLPQPVGNGQDQEFEVFVFDQAYRTRSYVFGVTYNDLQNDNSRFANGAWFLSNTPQVGQGQFRIDSDFMIGRSEMTGAVDTCWHEAQHALFFRQGGTRQVNDDEDLYLIEHARNATAAMDGRLPGFERALDLAQRAMPPRAAAAQMSRDEEAAIWGDAHRLWNAFLTAWNSSVTDLNDAQRAEYRRLTGVQIPTTDELAAFYRNGGCRAIQPPTWVLCAANEMPELVVSIWLDAVSRRMKERDGPHYRFKFDARGSVGAGVFRRPSHGTLTVRPRPGIQAKRAIRNSEDQAISNGPLQDWQLNLRTTPLANSQFFVFDLYGIDPDSVQKPITIQVDVEYTDEPNLPTGQTPYRASRRTVTMEILPPPEWAWPKEKREARRKAAGKETSKAQPRVAPEDQKAESLPQEGWRFSWGPAPAWAIAGFKDNFRREGARKIHEGTTRLGDLKSEGNTTLAWPSATDTALHNIQFGFKDQRGEASRPQAVWKCQCKVQTIEMQDAGFDEFRKRMEDWYRVNYSEPNKTINLPSGPYNYRRDSLSGFPAWVMFSAPDSKWVSSSYGYYECWAVILDQKSKLALSFEWNRTCSADPLFPGNKEEATAFKIARNAEMQAKMVALFKTFRIENTLAKPALNILTPSPWLRVGKPAVIEAELLTPHKPETVQFVWSEMVKAEGKTITVTPEQIGEFLLNVTAKGPDGPIATATRKIVVANVDLKFKLGEPLYVGVPTRCNSSLNVEGPVDKRALFVQWQPHPDVVFDPLEGPGTFSTKATFRRPGRVPVWTILMEKRGDTVATIAESDQTEATVQSPEFRIKLTPEQPYIGEETRARMMTEPAPGKEFIDFRWVPWPGNAQLLSESQDSSEVTFRPMNDRPVKLAAMARTPWFGDDLGDATLTVRAQPYNVTVIGRPTWSPSFATPQPPVPHQHVTFTARVSPAPRSGPCTYAWEVNEDSHLVSVASGNSTTVTRSTPGNCAVKVKVSDRHGNLIGEGAGGIAFVPSPSIPAAKEPKSKAQGPGPAQPFIPENGDYLFCVPPGWEALPPKSGEKGGLFTSPNRGFLLVCPERGQTCPGDFRGQLPGLAKQLAPKTDPGRAQLFHAGEFSGLALPRATASGPAVWDIYVGKGPQYWTFQISALGGTELPPLADVFARMQALKGR